jgi:hypothetical protein
MDNHAALLLGAPGAQAADGVDANGTLICAVVDLASCAPGDGCRRETADTINVPQLITVDRKEHVITARRPDGTLLSTNIDRTAGDHELVVFDGVQDKLSWTMSVAPETGRMSLSAIGDGQGFMVFGTCEPK